MNLNCEKIISPPTHFTPVILDHVWSNMTWHDVNIIVVLAPGHSPVFFLSTRNQWLFKAEFTCSHWQEVIYVYRNRTNFREPIHISHSSTMQCNTYSLLCLFRVLFMNYNINACQWILYTQLWGRRRVIRDCKWEITTEN